MFNFSQCRYCCSVAVFFCFGTTHFCNVRSKHLLISLAPLQWSCVRLNKLSVYFRAATMTSKGWQIFPRLSCLSAQLDQKQLLWIKRWHWHWIILSSILDFFSGVPPSCEASSYRRRICPWLWSLQECTYLLKLQWGISSLNILAFSSEVKNLVSILWWQQMPVVAVYKLPLVPSYHPFHVFICCHDPRLARSSKTWNC